MNERLLAVYLISANIYGKPYIQKSAVHYRKKKHYFRNIGLDVVFKYYISE